MEFDFLVSTSWSDVDVEVRLNWAAELERRGYQVAVLLVGDRQPDVAEGGATRAFNLDALSAGETVELAAFEREFGVPSIRHAYLTEKRYFGLSEADCLERANHVTSGLAALFEEHSFDRCIQARGGELHRILLHYLVANSGGTPIWEGWSPFEGTISLHTNLEGTWDTYRTVHYDEMTTEERESAAEYVRRFRERRRLIPKPGSSDEEEETWALHERTGDILRRLFKSDLPGDAWKRGVRELRWSANARVADRLLPSVQESGRLCDRHRFVFFPIQYPVESRVTVFAPEFYHQEEVIRYLSRSLPADVQLFVKPHPHFPGQHSPLWIQRLRRLPNVEFLHTDFHPHDAIEASEAVVSINNTAGVETVMYRKPVLNLGRAFWSDLPAVTTLDRLAELPETLSETIRGTVSEEAMLSSVHSLRVASFPGTVRDLDRENVERIVDGVEELIELVEP